MTKSSCLRDVTRKPCLRTGVKRALPYSSCSRAVSYGGDPLQGSSSSTAPFVTALPRWASSPPSSRSSLEASTGRTGAVRHRGARPGGTTGPVEPRIPEAAGPLAALPQPPSDPDARNAGALRRNVGPWQESWPVDIPRAAGRDCLLARFLGQSSGPRSCTRQRGVGVHARRSTLPDEQTSAVRSEPSTAHCAPDG